MNTDAPNNAHRTVRKNLMLFKLGNIFFAAIGLAFCAPTLASEETLRLNCAYTHTVDEDGKSSATSGETLFTINYVDTGKASIKKEGLGALFAGTVSDDEIHGEVAYKLGDMIFEEKLVINRFTGSMTISFGTPGRGGLVHFGKCRSATKKLF